MTQDHADKAMHDMGGETIELMRREHERGVMTSDMVFSLDVLEARFRQAKEYGWKTDWLRVHELAESILTIAADYPPTQAELEALENAA